jgi:hypothetical protein
MRRSTTAAVGVFFTAALSLTFSGSAQAADLDCPDFPNQTAAQATFDADPSDPNRLDGDDDGQACEDYIFDPAAADLPATPQVGSRPAGAVAAGDGSSATDPSSPLPYVLGAVALTAAGGAAFAARRSVRTAA